VVWREVGVKGAESRADKTTQPGAEGKGGVAAKPTICLCPWSGLFFSLQWYILSIYDKNEKEFHGK